MTPQMNLNFDPSHAPGWLLALLFAGTFAAEVLDRWPDTPSPTVTVDVCRDLCSGWVSSWTPTYCLCAIPDPDRRPEP